MLGIFGLGMAISFFAFTEWPPAKRSFLTFGAAWLAWAAASFAWAMYSPDEAVSTAQFLGSAAVGLVWAAILAGIWWLPLRWAWRNDSEDFVVESDD